MKQSKNKSIKILLYSLYIVIIDQISKLLVLKILGFGKSQNIIPNILNFTLLKNKGAAFGLFSNSTSLLTTISLLVSFLLIILIIKFPPRTYWSSIGFIYFLGGTLGNGIDRFFKGYVLDFLELVPIRFPIFNLADIAINIAIICFILDQASTKSQSEIL